MQANQPSQSASTPLRPVSQGERIPVLDILRGFALFGVLLAYTLWNLGSPSEHTYTQADRIINYTSLALVDTKCYTLFAVLFGLGFSIQLSRASLRGASIVTVYSRRLFVLIMIGLIHALLLRNGDILVPYAVMGFLLLLFRNVSSKSLFLVAIVALVFPYLARWVWGLTDIPFPQRPETEGSSYLADNYAWVRYWYATAITSWPANLPMFLFGLYLGRRRFFQNVESYQRGLLRTLIIGLVVGAMAFVGVELLNKMWSSYPHTIGQRMTLGTLWSVHAWGLAVFYALSLLLLLKVPGWERRLAPLGAVGRIALTNYLLQAIIVVPVCIVFDLFDNVTPVIGLLLAIGVWALQVPASIWWLKHFEFGPVEWVWRSLTYGRPQQMRRLEKT